MAGKKKATKTTAKAKKALSASKAGIDYELRKHFDKFRKDFAGLVGEVSRVDADGKRVAELAKEAKGAVSKLMRDPLVSVPQDLARKVVDLEARLAKVKTQLAERATVSLVDALEKRVKELEQDLENTCNTVAAHDDRLDDLDEAVTQPKEHADPPSHPRPAVDPRQTDLDDAIARAKEEDDGEEAMTPPPEGDVQNAETVS